ncbi:hypothetical protein [Salinicola lusitanus]|uniref:hypothetical protein n=1 Tax=Salinicola lusitanus TaxID=1949085 RepID=UPI000DA1CCC1|nr:hypothetical protein [Salinicola lusitanus]
MKERPILFSGDMVRALLEGRKTQTRRAVKINAAGRVQRAGKQWHIEDPNAAMACPYGQPGDRLYVKESHWAWGRWETQFDAKKGRDAWHFIDMTLECGKSYQFKQPVPIGTRFGVSPAWHKRPSLFMPRHASRILLDVSTVRVERLQEISKVDACREGLFAERYDWRVSEFYLDDMAYRSAPDAQVRYSDPRHAFKELWESINGTGSWAANPWAWVVEFRVAEPSEVTA